MSKKRFNKVVAVIVILAACSPLFTINCIGGHDITYHLLRIESLKEGILAGRPFLRINMLFMGGSGYASSLFYPDLLLYIPAVLRTFGIGINLAFHVFIAICIILGFISCYYNVNRIFKNDTAALASAIIFTLCQYHIDDIYTRSAVGEYTAMIFIPFVISGIYNMLFEDMDKPWRLFVGMSGVILCHTISAFICLLLCAGIAIYGIKNISDKKTVFTRVVVTAVCTLLFTSYYWIPVVEMLRSGAFSNDFVFDMDYESVRLWELAFNKIGRMGISIFIFLPVRLLLKKTQKFADICAVSGAILILCATSLLPWYSLQNLLGFMQFPWRLFAVAAPLLAIAEGIYLADMVAQICKGEAEKKDLSERVISVITMVIMIISLVSNLQRNDQPYYSYSDDYFTHKPFTAEIIGGEWLPVASSNRDAVIKDSDTVYADTGAKYKVRRYKNELFADGIDKSIKYIDVPFIYYKGYAAEDMDTGAVLRVSPEGRNGFVRVITEGAENIRVYYKGTTAQHVSDVVTMIFLIGIICYAVFYIRNNNKKVIE